MNKNDFPVLYAYNTNGKTVNQWQIVVDRDSFYTIEGVVGGKLTTSAPTVCKPKNVGRANETKAEEQAYAEALSRFNKKKDKHYNEVLTTQRNFREPMLAHKFEDHKPTFEVRTFIQPKLDGLRATNENMAITSRNGKAYIVPHLYQDETVFDGELYNHEYKDDFNKIVSLCKKVKPSVEELAESKEKVEYWVYDYPDHDGVFSERFDALIAKLDFHLRAGTEWAKQFIAVPTYEVHSFEEIEKLHDHFLEQGYEGSIIRTDIAKYEGKRSKQLLKYKDFKDEEFPIVSIEEGVGNRAGMAGYMVIRMQDGRTCKSNIKGGFDFYKELLRDRDKLVGKSATIKYFSKTPDGFLRFPVCIKVNREEYE